MNVAFSAIFALLLLLPGLIVIRVRPRTDDRANLLPPAPQALSSEAAMALMAAGLVNAIWYGLVYLPIHLFRDPVDVNLETVTMLLVGKYGAADADFANAQSSISSHPFCILFYFVGLYAFAIFLAVKFGKRLDAYLVHWGLIPPHDARVQEWREFFKADDRKSMAIVTAVVEMGGVAFLFLGRLQKLYFNSATGELDRLELTDTAKRRLESISPADVRHSLPLPSQWTNAGAEVGATESSQSFANQDESLHDFEEVFGNVFLLRYAELKTLNVVYADVESLQAGE